MQIRLGEVTAHCPHCGSADFAQLDPGSDYHEYSELLCSVCEAAFTHAELVLSIGPEALAAAARRLRGG